MLDLGLNLQFSILGFIIFMLPVVINIPYFMCKKHEFVKKIDFQYRWIETIEAVMRVTYAVVICFTVSQKAVEYPSLVMWIGIIFLILYYIVWIRYYIGGMSDDLLYKSFIAVPIPLAVFPVLYYVCGALFLHNDIGVIVMFFFGIAHYTVSVLTLK